MKKNISIVVLVFLIESSVIIRCDGLTKIETEQGKSERQKVTSLALNLYTSTFGYDASSEKLLVLIKYAKEPSDQGATLKDDLIVAMFNAPVAELFRKEQGPIISKVNEALAEAKSTIGDLYTTQKEFPIQLKLGFERFEAVINNYTSFFALMDSKRVSVKAINRIIEDSKEMHEIMEQITLELNKYIVLRKLAKTP